MKKVKNLLFSIDLLNFHQAPQFRYEGLAYEYNHKLAFIYNFKNMKIRLIYMFCSIIALVLKSTNNRQQKKHFQYDQRWKVANSINSLEQTVKQYPFLIQNIKIKNFLKIIDEGINRCIQCYPTRYLIVDNQVYLYQKQTKNSRYQHYKEYLEKIIKIYPVPDMYLLIHTYHDPSQILLNQQAVQTWRQTPIFVFNKNQSDYITSTRLLLPDNDMTILQWPLQIESIKNSSIRYQWKNKIPKIFYRGNCIEINKNVKKIASFPINRQVIISKCQRCGYVILSNQHPKLIDAKLTSKCQQSSKIINYFGKEYEESSIYGDSLLFAEQTKYRYLLSTNEVEDSWRKAASILFSNSVLFMPFSQSVQWFYHELIPDVNFIMIKDDLSDVIEKMKQLQQDQAKVLQIVKNGNALAQKHLTFQAVAKFTINQLTKYANIQNLNINKQYKNDIKNGIDAQLILKLKLMKQQWEIFNEYIAFDKIIKNFPEIKENIQISKLIRISKRNCNISLAKYIILDNKLYCESQYCSNIIAKGIEKIITNLLQNHIIPDTYFLIRVDQEDSLVQFSSKKILQSCEDLPYFVLSKDAQSLQERNKFLFPHPQFDSWEDEVKKFISNTKKIDWDKKQNKTYFGGILNQNFNLNLKLKRFQFIKSLTNIIKSRKQYFQAHTQRYFQLDKETVINVDEKYKYVLIAEKINTNQRKSLIIAMLSKVMVLSNKFKKLTWLDEKVIPGEHYIWIDQGLQNLKYTIQLLTENDQKIKKLCQEAFFFSSIELSTNFIHNFISNVLKSYSNIQKLSLSKQQKQQFIKGYSFQQAISQQKHSNYIFNIFLLIAFLILLYICIKVINNYAVIENKKHLQYEIEQDITLRVQPDKQI